MSELKPEWLRVKAPSGEQYAKVKTLLRFLQLNTVCEGARCPNAAECWGSGTATIMILGDTCTRGCRFCAVPSGDPHGALDPEEPDRAAAAVDELNLPYVVLTSVNRDDLPDSGAGHYARTISAIKAKRPDIMIEALVPDFQCNERALEMVVEARPEVIGHNIETVESLTPKVRDRRAGYRKSIEVLRAVKRMAPSIYTKSSIMLGLGETETEVIGAFKDLREAGVDILTIGQYLRPSQWHLPVEAYITPAAFERYKAIGSELGFVCVASGPLVRSSYRAGEFFSDAVMRRKKEAVRNGRQPL